MQDKVDTQHSPAGAPSPGRVTGDRQSPQPGLDQLAAERDAARQRADAMAREAASLQREMEALRSALMNANARLATLPGSAGGAAAMRRGGSGTLLRLSAVASVLITAVFLTVTGFHDAQSHVERDLQLDRAAGNALQTVQLAGAKDTSKEKKTRPDPLTGKQKTRFAKRKTATHRQWGPPLRLDDPDAPRPRVVFDPLVKTLQANLLTLGFDLGEADGFNGLRTRQAIDEFIALYLPGGAPRPKPADLVLITESYANLARSDAARFGMDRGVVAAIRLSSVRTGVEFSYLMKLAATESNFEPGIKSPTSSATGIYQFTHDTWLNAIKAHGASYGLADYAQAIEYYVTRSGYQRPMVADDALYRHLLQLRKNPRLAAMMAAESVRDNQRRLVKLLDRQPAQTDLYLTHFLGADGAITFLKTLKDNPDAFAVDLFPEAARSNQGIFHPKTCDPRTVDEVYELFGEKFSTRRYDDLAAY